MKKNNWLLKFAVLFAILVILLVLAAQKGILFADKNTSSQKDIDTLDGLCGPYKVVRVVDGDTLIVNIDGSDERVRLIGVNTPESVSPDEKENTQEGIDASAFTKNLLSGTNVYLEYDKDKYDDYDRILAYVYMTNEVMVNELLLEKGMAEVMTIEPNVKYVESFKQLEASAKENNIGFWRN